MQQVLTIVSFSFYPYQDKRALFKKVIDAFEQSGLVPRLEYIGTRYLSNGKEVREERPADRDEWINNNEINEWCCLRSSSLEDMIIYSYYPPANWEPERPVENIVVWVAQMNADHVPTVKKIIAEVALSVDLFSGAVSIYDNADIPGLQAEAYLNKSPAPFMLPYFAEPSDLQKTSIPWCADWINYWSHDTLSAIGFRPESDRHLFFDATELHRGWYLQLTEAPFDYQDPVHLARIKALYQRFKMIGGQDLIDNGSLNSPT